MFYRSMHLPANFKMSLIFFCCVVLHCVNVPHFPYPFIGRGAFRLFPGSAYDKQCCYEHSWAHVLVVRLSILWVYTQKWYCWVLRKVVFLVSEKSPYWYPKDCTNLHSHQQWRSVSFTPHLLQHKLSSVFFILTIFTGVRWNLRVVLICISLMAEDVEQHILKCLSVILDSTVESSLFRSVFHFWLDYLFYWWTISWVLCIFWRSKLCLMWDWWRSFPIL